jgi:uncharacterized OsmC-like protein
MADLQTSPYPLVFPLAGVDAAATSAPSRHRARVELSTLARALSGMQKEAVVSGSPNGRSWRMACDEGPYLNGTDLAPFPLAFFTTGLVNSYLMEILDLARLRGTKIGALELVQDNLYTMEGSAVRGDMIGGALPVALQVRLDADASEDALQDLVAAAVIRSPADALLRSTLTSEFSIVKNGEAVSVGTVRPAATATGEEDLSDATFDAVRPDPNADFPRDIVTKLAAAKSVLGAEGGAGSSLQSEQKRTLHVRGIAALRADGLAETQVQLFKPIGSSFRFLCDLEQLGGTRAPSPLEYLSAGVAFCFLTQIGRYAAILKHDVERYAIAQRTRFQFAGGDGMAAMAASADAVCTHVDIGADIDDATARKTVDMGERTCFLHAAARTPLKTRVRVEVSRHSRLGGEPAPRAASKDQR